MFDYAAETFKMLKQIEIEKEMMQADAFKPVKMKQNKTIVGGIDMQTFKIGDSREIRRVHYEVYFNRPQNSKEILNAKRIYLDVDNRQMFITDWSDNVTIFNYSSEDNFVIKKFEQIDNEVVTGFKTATLEELSSDEYVPEPIFETVVHPVEQIPFNPAVNDKDGYSIMRNCR